MYSLISKIFGKFGYSLQSTSAMEKEFMAIDPEFWEIHQRCSSYTMTSILRQYAVYSAVRYILDSKISGDFVECGVWRGGNIMIMIETLKLYGVDDRKIYLYDTFAGMTEPSEIDVKPNKDFSAIEFWKQRASKSGSDWCLATLDEVKSNLASTNYPSENIRLVKGMVEETLDAVTPNEVALLRLDTDFYSSTKKELDVLYPILVSGGVLLIDDYGAWEGAKKAVDEYFTNNTKPLFHRTDGTGRSLVKC